MIVKLPFLFWFLGATCLYAEHFIPVLRSSTQPPHFRPLEAPSTPKSDSLSQVQKILLGQTSSSKSYSEIVSLVAKLSPKEKEELLAFTKKKIPLVSEDSSFVENFYFTHASLVHASEFRKQSLEELEHLRKVIHQTLQDKDLPSDQAKELRALRELIEFVKDEKRREPILLKSPQKFPESEKPDPLLAPEVFQHPSGAIQMGRVEFERPNGKGFGNRIPISPGTSSGKGVLRISLHGTGEEANYTLLNPRSDEILVGYYGDLWRKKEKESVLRTLRKHCPQGINPSEIISESCNPDPRGASPATYASWLRVERLGDPSPSKLSKVVMTPKGFSSGGILDAPISRLFGEQGSFGYPYYGEMLQKTFNSELAPPREYRLSRGGNSENENDWIDTGIYTDSRQASLPLVGIFGEAKEYGRHLGLSSELGGGDSVSYLDKIRLINNNPDATYFQKVRSNWARPIGSAAAFVRELIGLSYDLLH